MRDARATPLGRGLIYGLMAGLLIGGLALLGTGAWNLMIGPDCTGRSPHECALARETAVDLGRYQVLFGGALALLGLSLAVVMRVRPLSSDNT